MENTNNTTDPDKFEDLEYLGKELLAQMSDQDKRNTRFTRRITRTLDYICIALIGVSALGFSIHTLAPEQTTQLYNHVTDSINSFYQTSSDSYSETLDS